MNNCLKKTDRRCGCLLAVALLLLWACPSGRANVYATNIKLNGSTNNAAMIPAGSVQISYILNDTASNVLVKICSGGSVIWSNSLAGTNAGSNSVVWGGTNQAGTNATAGVYQISITAAAAGYSDWTSITDDSTNFFLFDPISIAVNKNTNSPFYGRVFVGNDAPYYDNAVGIYKYNADGSPADEGLYSQGDYGWPNNPPGYPYSPWKIAVAEDDTVYINDWTSGVVLAFDEVISTNFPPVTVLASGFSGPCVTGGGANTQLWMADADFSGSSEGVVRWDVTNGTVAANDPGTVVVDISTNGVNLCPWEAAVDAGSNIYVIQCLDGYYNPLYASMPRLLCFPPCSGQPDSAPNWSIGSTNHELESAIGLAVDPTATWVAVAVGGYNNGGNITDLLNGSVNIYYANNGKLVTRLGAASTNLTDEFWDVAWDNVGNLYATDLSSNVWRAYSPPGPNQATTTAVPILQIYDAFTQPVLTNVVASDSRIGFTLQGQGNVTYVIESSCDLIKWSPVATNYDIVPNRAISVPGTNSACFFKAVVPQ